MLAIRQFFRKLQRPAPSQFLRDSIHTRLQELRDQCALSKERLRNASDPNSYWGDDTPHSTYWADLKAQAAIDNAEELSQALKHLKDFIVEHRPLMGDEWIGNDHGRLCWARFLGGYPIGMHYGMHYCQLAEDHSGPHTNADGQQWPQGVQHEHQWHALLKTLPPDTFDPKTGLPLTEHAEATPP